MAARFWFSPFPGGPAALGPVWEEADLSALTVGCLVDETRVRPRASICPVRRVPALAVVAVTLAAAAPVDARILVQRGIAGVELRMTKAQVRSNLGTPTRIRSGRNEFGRYVEFVYPRVTVSFQGGARATGLRTRSRLERTGRGIGVGSTEAEVKAKVADVRCRTESGFRHCFLGRFLPGRVITDFHIRRGRVSSVVVGFVLD